MPRSGGISGQPVNRRPRRTGVRASVPPAASPAHDWRTAHPSSSEPPNSGKAP